VFLVARGVIQLTEQTSCKDDPAFWAIASAYIVLFAVTHVMAALRASALLAYTSTLPSVA
jgi:hypothetical protein